MEYKVVFGVVCCLVVFAIAQKEVTVDTSFGSYKGREIGVESVNVTTFMGVAYAEPPTGKNRWRRTVPLKKFTQTKDALQVKNVCPQILSSSGNYTGDEDCLYMDITVGGTIDAKRLKPVVVYFNNDNAFQSGIRHSAVLWAKREAIVTVVVNSRLGALGYLYDGPGTGTMGLWDNLEALKFINSSIKAFGGDPKKITVMGVDSGALVVQLLASTKAAEGLFHQMIAMSPLTLGTESAQDMLRKMIREKAGCRENSMISCDISSLSAEEITQATSAYSSVLTAEAVQNDRDLFGDMDMSRLQNFDLVTGLTSAEELKNAKRVADMLSPDTDGEINNRTVYNYLKYLCGTQYTEASAQCLCVTVLRRHFKIEVPTVAEEIEVDTTVSGVALISTAEVDQDFNETTNATISDEEAELEVVTTTLKPSDPYKGLSALRPLVAAYARAGFFDLLAAQSGGDSGTYVYLMDIKEDPKVVGLPEEENTGADSSIMQKLAFGYYDILYGRTYESINSALYKGDLFSGMDASEIVPRRSSQSTHAYYFMRYLANFVKAGDPAGYWTVPTDWPDYKENGEVMKFTDGKPSQVVEQEFPNMEAYEFFSGVFFAAKECQSTE